LEGVVNTDRILTLQIRVLMVFLAALVAASPVLASKRTETIAKTSYCTPAKKTVALSRPEFSPQDQQSAEIPGFPGVRFWASSDEDYRRAIPTKPGPWLALSSGAEDGAYGAGFLSGWNSAGTRPEFAVITGVSTGALLGVYAFAGSKYNGVLQAISTSMNASDIFEIRATPESLLDTWPLQRLVEKNVTAELLADVAAQYRRGRRLFVVTTNLDAGRAMVWDMGAIADKGGEQALELFRKVLLASASIPAAFPPTLIEAEVNGRRFLEMHVDGGVNGPIYVAPESYLLSTSGRQLPMLQLNIVMNGKVTTEFSKTERSTAIILARSFSLALKLGARAELFLLEQAAQRDGVDLNVVMVEPDFYKKERGAFDPEYMRALFDHGFKKGRKSESRD
jgi:predicted acylesterase/phospholipase RssA